MKSFCYAFLVMLMGLLSASLCRAEGNDWYWDTVVNLHIDNHSRLEGQGHTAEEIAEWLRPIPVDMVQVSAYGNQGHTITYQSEALKQLEQQPQQGAWDTLGVWSEAVRSLDRRFHVYINTRGMKVHTLVPEFMQQDAKGKGRGQGKGSYDACPRSAADGHGYLEEFLLPLLDEIVTKYQPGGIWIDGDHARTPTCYCRNCRAAWTALTGKAVPPVDSTAADWPRWLDLEQKRYDEYRRRMAETMHAANPNAMYTSNHSWRKIFGTNFEKIDPRSAPAFTGSYSADLSHGNSIQATRISAMSLSAEEETPYDIMHLINAPDITEGRVLQQGAVTLASGGAWFLWALSGTIEDPRTRERVKQCATFAQARKAALGRTTSRNQTAVLSSETSWLEERVGGRKGYYPFLSVNHFALGLQDAGYGVDLVNERMLRKRSQFYRTVFVPDQRKLHPDTLAVLKEFVRDGGMVVVAGSGLLEADADSEETKEWLGLSRGTRVSESQLVEVAGESVPLSGIWSAELEGAEVLATTGNGQPFVTRKKHGKGSVAWVAKGDLVGPDFGGLIPWLTTQLGFGPMVSIEGNGALPHLAFSLRAKGDALVLHVSDLTSRVNGKKVEPGRTTAIDDAVPVKAVTLRLPVAAQPEKVRVVPDTANVSHSWSGGILELRLENLLVHAAVMIEGAASAQPDYLPVETSRDSRFAYAHYRGLFSIDDGFEMADHGHAVNPLSGYTVRTGGQTKIRVTDKNAAGGKQCVEFLDHPDADQAYMPYLFVQPQGLDRGIGHFAVDLKIERGAEPSIDFRTIENRREYPAGPGLTFHDGKMSAQKKGVIAEFPYGEWFRIEIQFPLAANDGKYTLRVMLPGEEAREFAGLPYFSGPAFQRCGWIGFMAGGQSEASFYIDNLSIRRE